MGGNRGSPCGKCRYFKRAIKKKKAGGLFFKVLVALVVGHGMVCVSMSYALAWMEHTQVVEGVSSTIITEIVAPIIVYGFTKTVENIFQKNKLKFSEPIAESRLSARGKAEESEEFG